MRRSDDALVFTDYKLIYPDYVHLVQNHMDFNIMDKKIKEKQYDSCKYFLKDMELLRDNCKLYNGHACEISKSAEKLYQDLKKSLDDIKIGDTSSLTAFNMEMVYFIYVRMKNRTK